MKILPNGFLLLWLNVFLLLLAGCGVLVPVPYAAPRYALEGQTKYKQPDHSVELGGVDYFSPAKEFILTFSGVKNENIAPVNLIEARYKYYSEDWLPLAVASFESRRVVLVPKAKIVSKPIPKRTEKSGEIRHGRYKIYVKYVLNGENFECNFDVVYISKTETGIVGPWNGKGLN